MSHEEAVNALEGLIELVGPGFHIDIPFTEYVKIGADGEQAFPDTLAREAQQELDAACDVLGDLAYDIADDFVRQQFATDEERSYGPRR